MCAACQDWQGLPGSSGGPSGSSWGLKTTHGMCQGILACVCWLTSLFSFRCLCFSVSARQQQSLFKFSKAEKKMQSECRTPSTSLRRVYGHLRPGLRRRELATEALMQALESQDLQAGESRASLFFTSSECSKRPPRRPTAMRRSVAFLWRPRLECAQGGLLQSQVTRSLSRSSTCCETCLTPWSLLATRRRS